MGKRTEYFCDVCDSTRKVYCLKRDMCTDTRNAGSAQFIEVKSDESAVWLCETCVRHLANVL